MTFRAYLLPIALIALATLGFASAPSAVDPEQQAKLSAMLRGKPLTCFESVQVLGNDRREILHISVNPETGGIQVASGVIGRQLTQLQVGELVFLVTSMEGADEDGRYVLIFPAQFGGGPIHADLFEYGENGPSGGKTQQVALTCVQ